MGGPRLKLHALEQPGQLRNPHLIDYSLNLANHKPTQVEKLNWTDNQTQ